jgi:2'-5' RNA ligase
MTRTFIAVELNDEARSYLHQQIQGLARFLPRVRWVDPETLHLTLAFLGELDDAQLAQAMQVAAETAETATAFTVRIGSLGIFGPPHNPRVIWIGLDGRLQALLDLQMLLAEQLVRVGFPPEERAYAPHLTLARIKTPLSRQELIPLQRRLTAVASRAADKGHALLPEIPVTHVSVMRSDVTREGPHYSCLQRSPLAL